MVVVIAVAAFVLLGGDDDPGSTTGAGAECEAVDAPEPKTVDLPGPKAKQPSATKVVFDTSCGSFTVTLDTQDAPKTAASFQYLAEQGVFDNTPFHRVVPGFVVQGGDPEGTGLGGPGYTVTEPPPRDMSYDRGLVAMAKSPADPPGTSGSQFFVVTAPADAGLGPDFAVVGEVTDGFDTVLAIEALGDESGESEEPSMPVLINSARVEA